MSNLNLFNISSINCNYEQYSYFQVEFKLKVPLTFRSEDIAQCCHRDLKSFLHFVAQTSKVDLNFQLEFNLKRFNLRFLESVLFTLGWLRIPRKWFVDLFCEDTWKWVEDSTWNSTWMIKLKKCPFMRLDVVDPRCGWFLLRDATNWLNLHWDQLRMEQMVTFDPKKVKYGGDLMEVAVGLSEIHRLKDIGRAIAIFCSNVDPFHCSKSFLMMRWSEPSPNPDHRQHYFSKEQQVRDTLHKEGDPKTKISRDLNVICQKAMYIRVDMYRLFCRLFVLSCFRNLDSFNFQLEFKLKPIGSGWKTSVY